MPDYSAGTASVEISPNFGGFIRKLRADLERVEAELGIEIRPDLGAFTSELEAELARIDASLEVDIRPDAESLASLQQTVQAYLDAMALTATVRLEADTNTAAAEIEAFRVVAGAPLRLDVEANTNTAAAEMAAWRQAVSGDITVNVNANTTGAATRIAGLSAAGRAGGSGGGGGFGLAGVLNAGAIGIAQLPAAATAVATIGADVQALAQSAALLPAIFAGGAAAVGTLTVGMQGFKDALGDSPEKAVKAMDGMSTSARNTVLALRDYSDEWEQTQNRVQESLWSGVDNPLRTAIDAQLPVVSDGMSGLAGEFNEGLKVALGELAQGEASSGLAQIFANTTVAAGNLNHAIGPVTDSIGLLAERGSTLLPGLADDVTGVAARFDAWLTRADEAGDLTRWMREGVDAAKTLGSIVGNLGSSLTSIFRAVKGDGDGFLVTVEKLTTRMSEWLSSDIGQATMRQFFADGRDQLDQWLPILSSIGSTLVTVYEAAQTWSAIMMPFLQAAAGLISDNEGAVRTLLVAWLAYRTLSPILSGVQSGIAGMTTRVDAFRTASASAATAGAGGLRSAIVGLGTALGTGGVLGIGVAAAAIGLGFLAQKHQEAKQAADEQKRALDALGQTLEAQSGRVTEETVTQAAGMLEDRGFLERAQSFGINTHEFVEASVGLDPGAKQQINDRLTQVILEQMGSVDGKYLALPRRLGLSDTDIAQALQGIPEAVQRYRDVVGEGPGISDLGSILAQMNDIGESAATLGGEMNNVNSEVAQLGESTRRKSEAANGIFELTEQGKKSFGELKVAIQDVTALDGDTVLINTPTDEQKQAVLQLGDVVRELPDGSIVVDLNDEAAKAAIREIVKPETKTVTINEEYVRATASGEWRAPMVFPQPKAAGGEITGGIPGVDSVPLWGMPGEHMLTTDDVDRLGGQAGVYRFRAALQAGLVRPYATGGAVGWTDEDERELKRAEIAVTRAQDRARVVEFDKDASDADRLDAQLDVQDALDKAQKLADRKAGRNAPTTEVLPQAPLPHRRSDSDIQIDNTQMAVDEANTERNRVYNDPTSTDADRRRADNDYLSAQNAHAEARKSKGKGEELPEQYSLPGILGAAGTIVGQGILSFFGLENSIFSGSNVYNQALNTTLDFYQNKNEEEQAEAGGYDYVPQNMPVETEDSDTGNRRRRSGSSSSSSDSSSEDGEQHTYDPGAGVEQWRPTFAAVLSALGMPSSWLGLGLAQMQSESGGNPRAINLWDSNAEKGIPSKGLMQVIDPTFQSYRSGLYPNDIWHPSANIAASLQYLVDRYGGPEGVWGEGHGYDLGGLAQGIGLMPKWTIKPERVLSPRQTEVFESSLPLLESINASLALPSMGLPAGMTPRGGDAPTNNTTRDHSVNFHGDTYVMNVDHLMREQDRWTANQAVGALAVYS
ncbi:transglycosylase SLT domain-containing protein [Nocardia cyriacigeorgica]|uniref:lytic transglycosylase domain-containing protein n=1 Tax=Nocardia cyriacigeorgica TaxID=135487 RepID=UPI002454DFE3|nr:transglycosylase SLT domain-containing protein [Nocardia cyriacigeorgica]